MKYILLSLLLFFVTGNSRINSLLYSSDSITTNWTFEQSPFNFLNPVPEKNKLLDNVDLSFYVNQSIVFQYRFRVEFPKTKTVKAENQFAGFSDWENSDIRELKLQKPEAEGIYKLVIEYKTHSGNEIKRFEKAFEVYWENPEVKSTSFNVNIKLINSGIAINEKYSTSVDEFRKAYDSWLKKFKASCSSLKIPSQNSDQLIEKLSEKIVNTYYSQIAGFLGTDFSAKEVLKPEQVHELIQNGKTDLILVYRNSEANLAATMASASKAAIQVYQQESKKIITQTGDVAIASGAVVAVSSVTLSEQSKEPPAIEKEEKTETLLSKQKEEIDPVVSDRNEKPDTTLSEKQAPAENIAVKDYNKLLLEAIEKGDAGLFRESVSNGADTKISGKNGGNIFHLMAGSIGDESLVATLRSKGISINEPDNYGNSPLHYSILIRDFGYAVCLVRQGADINLINRQNLSSLHLSVLVNGLSVTKELLSSGANVNTIGNTGYTPLHIAAELNNLDIAKELLLKSADIKSQTEQKLNAKTIAGIQNGEEMQRLIKTKGMYKFDDFQTTDASKSIVIINSSGYPDINFSLPYDKELVRKLDKNKLVQWITIPLFVVSAASSVYLRSKANSYYSSYKNAATEDEAQALYDKTNRYDTYALVSAGVSVVSLYGFIQSTINKKHITSKMRKTF